MTVSGIEWRTTGHWQMGVDGIVRVESLSILPSLVELVKVRDVLLFSFLQLLLHLLLPELDENLPESLPDPLLSVAGGGGGLLAESDPGFVRGDLQDSPLLLPPGRGSDGGAGDVLPGSGHQGGHLRLQLTVLRPEGGVGDSP